MVVVDRYKGTLQEGLDLLAERLDPIIETRLAGDLHGLAWTVVLTELDKSRGKPGKHYDTFDLQAQLRMLTERLGGLGHPFESAEHPSRLVSTLGNELRIVRNRWAHGHAWTALDVWRALDFVVRLLDALGDVDGASTAIGLRDSLARDVFGETGHAPAAVTAPEGATTRPQSGPTAPVVIEVDEPIDPATETVEPEASVIERDDASATPTIGARRGEYEPWTPILVGDLQVLDDLPKKAAKEQVRAVAAEIVEFEGPIHIDRLVQLVAASFGLSRVYAARHGQLVRQVRAAGLAVDSDKFVWPAEVGADAWVEFRPSPSTIRRDFLEISPREIRNAAAHISTRHAGIDRDELERSVLQTFGKKRRTKAIAAHLRLALG